MIVVGFNMTADRRVHVYRGTPAAQQPKCPPAMAMGHQLSYWMADDPSQGESGADGARPDVPIMLIPMLLRLDLYTGHADPTSDASVRLVPAPCAVQRLGAPPSFRTCPNPTGGHSRRSTRRSFRRLAICGHERRSGVCRRFSTPGDGRAGFEDSSVLPRGGQTTRSAHARHGRLCLATSTSVTSLRRRSLSVGEGTETVGCRPTRQSGGWRRRTARQWAPSRFGMARDPRRITRNAVRDKVKRLGELAAWMRGTILDAASTNVLTATGARPHRSARHARALGSTGYQSVYEFGRVAPITPCSRAIARSSASAFTRAPGDRILNGASMPTGHRHRRPGHGRILGRAPRSLNGRRSDS
jgi:hypothetical protein